MLCCYHWHRNWTRRLPHRRLPHLRTGHTTLSRLNPLLRSSSRASCSGPPARPPADAPHLQRDWAHPSHVCSGTWHTPATTAPGLGSALPTSAPGLARPADAPRALERHELVRPRAQAAVGAACAAEVPPPRALLRRARPAADWPQGVAAVPLRVARVPAGRPATSAPGLGPAASTSAPGLGLAAATSAPGLGRPYATSAPGLGLTPYHICVGTCCSICAGMFRACSICSVSS